MQDEQILLILFAFNSIPQILEALLVNKQFNNLTNKVQFFTEQFFINQIYYNKPKQSQFSQPKSYIFLFLSKISVSHVESVFNQKKSFRQQISFFGARPASILGIASSFLSLSLQQMICLHSQILEVYLYMVISSKINLQNMRKHLKLKQFDLKNRKIMFLSRETKQHEEVRNQKILYKISWIYAFYNKMARQFQRSSEYSRRSQGRKRAYISVKYEDRIAVIRQVYYRKRRIIDVSREIGINPSTVKMIVHRYRNSGLIFQKRQQRQAREIQERAMLYWYMYMYQWMWWQYYWANNVQNSFI